jgi:hypothetical protein
VQVVEDTINSPTLRTCLIEAYRTIRYPERAGAPAIVVDHRVGVGVTEFGRIEPAPCTALPAVPQQGLSATAPQSNPPHGSPQPTQSETSSLAPDQASLAAEKRRVLGLRAPRYSGSGEREDALRFVKGDLVQWIQRRAPATDAIIKRYEQGQDNAKSPARAAALSRDVAELQLDFCREFLSGGQSAMPPDIRNDVELRKAYTTGLVETVRDRLDLAARAATNCLEKAFEEDRELASRCKTIRTEVEGIRCLR